MSALLLALAQASAAGVVTPTVSAVAPLRSIASFGWALRRVWSISEEYATTSTVLLPGLSLERDVAIRPSGRCGNGVFARRDLPASTLVGWYTGAIVAEADQERREEEDKTYTGAYIMRLCDTSPAEAGEGWLIDGEDARMSSWTRYINHSVRRQNVAAYYLTPRAGLPARCGAIYLEAIKPIREGQELFLDYGQAYWNARVPFLQSPLQRLAIDYL
jgi:SET domain-containing protein